MRRCLLRVLAAAAVGSAAAELCDEKNPCVKLRNGAQIPAVSLGTCCYKDCPGADESLSACWARNARAAAKAWMDMGGHATDTAQLYRNAPAVGEASVRPPRGDPVTRSGWKNIWLRKHNFL